MNNSVLDEFKEVEYDILKLFAKDEVEEIQKKIANVTGLAFVTVDYKGEPVTEKTDFSEFCKFVREDPNARKICMSSDAYGSIQAAVTKKTHIYICPCGLVEIAIPIVINGHYLGGFIGGQINCPDVPNDIPSLKNVMKQDEKILRDSSKLISKTNKISYKELISISELVSLIITQMAKNKMLKIKENKEIKENLETLKEKRKLTEIKYNLKEVQLKIIRSQLQSHFLYNCLNSISNMAIIEEAEKTNEIVVKFSEYLRLAFENKKTSIKISEELQTVDDYLKIQKIRFGDKLDYKIILDDNLKNQKIPYYTIMPFVEDAVVYGIIPKIDKGTIEINISCVKEDVVIVIKNNGIIISEEDKIVLNNYYKENKDYKFEIENVEKRFLEAFGKNYSIKREKVSNQETTITIKYPKTYKEEVFLNV